ncbi:23S rRNA (cytidine1920-2'-O)/16S rRNA (cytidine1409-2'-O)-methyltransferase [Kytococcus aerolatus]|uniref:23S rRNA (Cytidine1920-2'-O)/16S rRNA (Cytidine1409-2'-O)-methyltransferase n=1 Tax=Kytococcus aerolatus TaxID=592308 RepID=A0A212SZD8_9MICO|nr:TlyA family RNA methyltransferase [Kytococcus aerolatus]SNC59162.1 23S rRNA (cytidine1920-2'-O)/16S rRNA (cytidine1409-2'-O)-methyltransferase [Kytococcus aerolatus]
MSSHSPGAPLRADRAVLLAGLSRSRQRAQSLIDNGLVLTDGAPVRARSQVVLPESLSLVEGAQPEVQRVSRAQRKLERALELWPDLHAPRASAVDLGASTGGFTQVLLHAGCARAWAVDVGHDQLVPELREDPRVRVREGVNARHVEELQAAGLTGGMTDLVVSDVSFISVRHLLGPIAWLLASGGTAVVLVKPQFEVGPEGVSGGVVRAPARRRGAVHAVCVSASREGLHPRALAASGLPGRHGNVEFLLRLTRLPAARAVGAAWEGVLPDADDSFWEGHDECTLDL